MDLSNPELYLHEQTLLLALSDASGTIDSKARNYAYALGGAILAELILCERLRIRGDEHNLIEALNEGPVGVPSLDEALALVAADKKARSAVDWVRKFAVIKDLKHKVAHELCGRGILSDSEKKALVFFTRKVYPEIDHEPEQRVIDEMRGAIFSEKKHVEPRIAILLSLAHASGILRIHFESDDLSKRSGRIDEIISGSLFEGATQVAIDAAEMARQLAPVSATSSGDAGAES